MTNFNATLAQNTEVRKEIDHLVQERSNFNDLIAKLQKKSQANKRIIADITEMAILAFDQRDESQSKITAFQVCNDCYIFAYIFTPRFMYNSGDELKPINYVVDECSNLICMQRIFRNLLHK